MTVADLVRCLDEAAILGLLAAGAELRPLALTQAAGPRGRAASPCSMTNSNALLAAQVQSEWDWSPRPLSAHRRHWSHEATRP